MTGGMVHGVGPEFQPQYCKKENKEIGYEAVKGETYMHY
jgi:hypothetical protein